MDDWHGGVVSEAGGGAVVVKEGLRVVVTGGLARIRSRSRRHRRRTRC